MKSLKQKLIDEIVKKKRIKKGLVKRFKETGDKVLIYRIIAIKRKINTLSMHLDNLK